MKTFLVIMFTLSSLALAEGANRYKGYAEINQILKERVTGITGFELGKYFGEPYSAPVAGSLIELLGTYTGADIDGAFRNGAPNSMNLLVWAVLLSQFAREIGGTCPGLTAGKPLSLPLSEDFRRVLSPLCQWPKTVATSPVALKAYWDALMGYDAPSDEFESWLTFASQEAGSGSTAPTAISRITVAALLNPYFLLWN
jgi:hypothetical protein